MGTGWNRQEEGVKAVGGRAEDGEDLFGSHTDEMRRSELLLLCSVNVFQLK